MNHFFPWLPTNRTELLGLNSSSQLDLSVAGAPCVFRRFLHRFILLDRTHDQPIWILLGSFYEAKCEPILVGVSFGLSPSDICNPLAEKPDDERILAISFIIINDEKLRDPVGHDVL